MPRADFYVLPEQADAARFSCSLASKAWREGHRPHILAASRDAALGLDELLWTFQDISFVPHGLMDDDDRDQVPVTIGWPELPLPGGDLLINLSNRPPEHAAGFQRVAEIVAGDPEQRQLARDRYREYRDRGFELHSHEIKTGARHG